MDNVQEAINQSYLKLLGWKIKKIEYMQEFDNYNSKNEGNLNMEIKLSDINDDNVATYSLFIKVNSDTRTIAIEIIANFEIKSNIDLTDTEKFIKGKGTEIIYPYIRSIISVTSSIDGSSPINLPIININTLMEDE